MVREVPQRSCGLPVPESVESQDEWSSWSSLVQRKVPYPWQGAELDDLLKSLPTQTLL